MSRTNTRYQIFKSRLRIEFSHSCVYCDIREPEGGGSQNFSIDHYKPKKKFPDLSLEYNNLLYACSNCNRYKGDYWPNTVDLLLKRIVLNPRVDKPEEHIDKREFLWKGKTDQGIWNVIKFRLDSARAYEWRKGRYRIELIIEDLKNKLNQLYLAKKNGAPIEIDEDIFEISENIDVLTRKISGSMD